MNFLQKKSSWRKRVNGHYVISGIKRNVNINMMISNDYESIVEAVIASNYHKKRMRQNFDASSIMIAFYIIRELISSTAITATTVSTAVTTTAISTAVATTTITTTVTTTAT